MISNDREPVLLDSTDEQAVMNLVMSLIETESTEYTVLNEHQEDITYEIKKLVSFQSRMLKGDHDRGMVSRGLGARGGSLAGKGGWQKTRPILGSSHRQIGY
ncbi:MAG: hypothetical protein ACO3NK_16435 [Prochlorotrichaceae cyanobacterium]|jgi:hypothetical protein